MTASAGARERVRVRVPAKINLALRVGGVMPNGYHPLATVFQAVSLFDEITAADAPAGEYSITVSGPQAHLVPTDDSNLAIRAARAVAGLLPDPGRVGVRLHIAKEIPVAGGMAGGSATPRARCSPARRCGAWTRPPTTWSGWRPAWAPTCRSAWSATQRWERDAVTS